MNFTTPNSVDQGPKETKVDLLWGSEEGVDDPPLMPRSSSAHRKVCCNLPISAPFSIAPGMFAIGTVLTETSMHEGTYSYTNWEVRDVCTTNLFLEDWLGSFDGPAYGTNQS